MLEIPNKDYLGFVASDGHYNLFGITLLRKQQAVKYYGAYFDEPYTVGEYYDLHHYQHRLASAGCDVFVLPARYSPDFQDIDQIRSGLGATDRYSTVTTGFSRWLYRFVKPGFHVGRALYQIARLLRNYVKFILGSGPSIPKELRNSISRNFSKYMRDMILDIVPAIVNKSKRREFEQKYLMPTWLVMARKM